jgi:hypothetical protein
MELVTGQNAVVLFSAGNGMVSLRSKTPMSKCLRFSIVLLTGLSVRSVITRVTGDPDALVP